MGEGLGGGDAAQFVGDCRRGAAGDLDDQPGLAARNLNLSGSFGSFWTDLSKRARRARLEGRLREIFVWLVDGVTSLQAQSFRRNALPYKNQILN